MIALQSITKTFKKKSISFNALDNVSLLVPSGKIMGVIGASGAGKSTLIRCVNLLERPTQGEVIVDGQHLLALSPSQLARARRQIGMIFQHFNLLSSRTVFGNVAFPLELDGTPKAQVRKRVEELLALVGLSEKSNDYPSSLSGGQKQRVAIARTLASKPKVLLCDEATSALDPATTRSILHLLKDINRRLGITILLITHEMDVVKSICDEVAIISEGRLIEQGTVSAVFSSPKTDLAKHFIASSLQIEIPAAYKERLSDVPGKGKHPLLKLEISGKSANTPVLSTLSRQLGIDFQIVSAQLDHAGHVKFGMLLIELIGLQEHWQPAIDFLEQQQVTVTLIGYV